MVVFGFGIVTAAKFEATELLAPPERPTSISSIEELRRYIQELNMYYLILARPRKDCPTVIPHQEFRLSLLLPAAICTLILAFLTRRTKQKLHLLNGRPGLVFPMDILKRSHRFSYAAAFGTLARLCSDIVFEAKYAFNYDGPTYLKVFIALTSMLIYGLGYYPLFAGITAESPIGYLIATLFAWTFTANFFANSFCEQNLDVSYFILIVMLLPEIVCYLYLSFSLPARFVLSIVKPKKKTKLAVDFESSEDLYESILKSYQGNHVRKLFRKPEPPSPPPEGKKNKIISLLKTLSQKIFYRRKKGFRYSARMMSVISVGFVLLYTVFLELFLGLYQVFEFLEDGLIAQFNVIGWDPQPGETEGVGIIRDGLYFAYYFVISFGGCFLASLTVAFLINTVFLFHYLTSYRKYLLSLYKGKPKHLTPKSEKSNASLMVGSVRYAGYQVGYIGWGFFIQFLVLLLVSITIATIITIWDLISDFIISWIMALWPVLLTSLVLNFVQLLLSKFLFLQENGNILAMENRRLFFIFTYFMFFYNVFIGLISCLMRIIKSIILGALFLPRLDHSVLPRKFQQFDPGFDAYCGFMHIESTHTNPVAMVFISILQAESLTSLKRKKMNDIDAIPMDEKEEMIQKKRRKARWKWLLAFTLVNNPELSLQRRLTLAKERNENVKEILFSSYAVPIEHGSIDTKF
ncbi:receptor for retinol uptake stra6-like [Saccostrea echinata]|uniref:receptor for retinol uptake stra6-like n=1 Tax=Saccostrea echinata TaxID=191078 RepID=UPI002A7ECCD2|nr:receptor for retinol uptake stra6-like [Saccostrea echinata]